MSTSDVGATEEPAAPPGSAMVSEGSWDHPVYSIGAVGRMLAVASSTLRSWEERYGLVVAHRSEGGHRLYSREQVAELRFVKSEVDRGRRAGEAHRLLEQRRLAEGAGSTTEAPAAGRLLVLLAERDPYAAELSEFFLHTEGYAVEVVLDLDAVRSTFDDARPDLVLVELLLAGGRGTELVRELSGRGARVLATSALQLEDEALRAGAEAFLRKPVDPLQLVSTVRDLLGTSALTRGRP